MSLHAYQSEEEEEGKQIPSTSCSVSTEEKRNRITGTPYKMPPSLSAIMGMTMRAVWKHGLFGAWRQAKQNQLGAGFWDGGLLVSKLKTDGANLVGVDNVGNKYWEKYQNTQHGTYYGFLLYLDKKQKLQIVFVTGMIPISYSWDKNSGAGRHRWVEYASARDYDATSVPPEWHGWLHHITDHLPEQLEDLKPKRYGLEQKQKAIYMAKGHPLHPQKRIWKHYETWTGKPAAPMEKSQEKTKPKEPMQAQRVELGEKTPISY